VRLGPGGAHVVVRPDLYRSWNFRDLLQNFRVRRIQKTLWVIVRQESEGELTSFESAFMLASGPFTATPS
jgi:hypothetical protein